MNKEQVSKKMDEKIVLKKGENKVNDLSKLTKNELCKLIECQNEKELQLTKEIDGLKLETANKYKELKKFKKKCFDYGVDNSILVEENRSIANVNNYLKEQNKNLEYENNTLKAELETKDASIKAFIEDKDRLNDKVKELNESLGKLEDNIHWKEESIKSLKEDCNKIKTESEEYSKELLIEMDKRNNKISELEAWIERYKNIEQAMEKDLENRDIAIKVLAEVLR